MRPSPSARTSNQLGPLITRVRHRDGQVVEELSYKLGRSLLSDGDFASGTWGPVGNCAAFPGTAATAGLSARVLRRTGPGGTAGTRAVRDSGQCVRGALAGLAVRTALPEPLGPQRQRRLHRGYASGRCPSEACAAMSPLPPSSALSRWYHYQTIVTPDPGTRRLTLFLYADVYTPGALQPTSTRMSSSGAPRSLSSPWLWRLLGVMSAQHQRSTPRARVSRRTGSGRPEISMWRSMDCATAGSARAQESFAAVRPVSRGTCCRALPRFSLPVSC